MRAGDKVRCVDAKEAGIPVTEGETYTVKRWVANGMTAFGDLGGSDGPVESRNGIPGVTLEEVDGYFMATRFEVVQ